MIRGSDLPVEGSSCRPSVQMSVCAVMLSRRGFYALQEEEEEDDDDDDYICSSQRG